MKTKNIGVIVKSIVAIVIMTLLCVIYSFILSVKVENERLNEIFSNVEAGVYANIEDYTIYGNHLNFSGYILKENITNFSVEKIRVIIKSEKGYYEEIIATLNEDDEKYLFTISSNINEGINLENFIIQDKYIIFLKLSGNDINNEYIEKMYSLNNVSPNNVNEYYTITKNAKNNKIEIKFSNEEDINIMSIVSTEVILPDGIYDFVIDAGHGGTDPGAIYGQYEEAQFTLQYAKDIKEKLEELGYKVKLTRQEDVYVKSYGENSRSAIPFETKAKLVISIHLNSSYYDENDGGVEIYAPNNANLDFAKSLADNIVEMAGTQYSVNSSMRVLDGVYVRTFTQQEIDSFKQEAEESGYNFYETITTDTNYLFMIREIGGKITGAYMDGRSPNGATNIYKDSNIGAESYLIEIGYINSSKDLDRMINNKEAYIDAIVKCIVEKYN